MSKKALTDLDLRTLQPPSVSQICVWDEKLPTFGVRVSQGGTKTFVVKSDGTYVSIGRYPIISLAQAREEAKRILAERTLGRHRPRSITYPAAVEAYLKDKRARRRPRTVADYERQLNLFKFKGQLGAITNEDIERKLEPLRDRPSEFNHCLTTLTIFFNWCIPKYLQANPCKGIAKYPAPRRKRVLSDGELRAVWKALESPKLLPAFRYIVKLLIVTGQRRGEIAALHSDYLSADTCQLPGTLTKNHRDHLFPLGPLAQRILAEFKDYEGHLFAANSDAGTVFSAWSQSKKLLDRLSGVRGWRLHDLRRTFRTNLGRLGVKPYIAERLVNHVSARTDMEETYDVWTYLPEMREAVENWERHFATQCIAQAEHKFSAAA